MNVLNCTFIVIIIFLLAFLIFFCMKINTISKCIDEILDGNLNQRVRFQTHIKILSVLMIKINSLTAKLQSVEEKSRISEESRKKMISNISHDLRTPLTSILGYVELIINDDNLTEDEKRRYMKIVYNKGNYLYNMLEDFFQISKMDSNDFKLNIKRINVCEIIRQNMILFFNEFKKLNIEPKINFEEENVYAKVDEKALERILSNLINNALKYGKNSTQIGVDLTFDENTVFVSVWDNGCGIPKDDIEYIFDRLYTVEKSRRLNIKSSGLGLSIVKKLVELLGGTIKVSSIPFKRTEFKFTLKKM